MVRKDEAERLSRRIAKAERRLARGIDKRQEKDGVVSELAVLDRLRQLQEAKKS